MSAPSSVQASQWIDMGKLKDFEKRLKRLQTQKADTEYRFASANGDFWLFEAENQDEILGALLHVNGDHVYAISEDVYKFVNATLA